MKRKIVFSSIILSTMIDKVYAVNKISCGNTSGIPEGLPGFTRTIIVLIKYIVPLALILFGSIDFLKVIVSEDKKELDKATKKFMTRTVAGVSVFFVIYVVLSVFGSMNNSSGTIECIRCFAIDDESCVVYYEEDDDHTSEKEEDNKKREALEKKRDNNRKNNEKKAESEKKKAEQEKDPDNVLNGRISGNIGELDFSCTSNTVKSRFSCDTLRIVERHLYDFDSSDFKHTIQTKYGNFNNYMSSLGGVFSNFYGRKLYVKTASELQWVSEYVFGMMYMFGFDYYNGINRKYCKWGGGDCVQMSSFFGGARPNPATDDAFWKGNVVHYQEGISDPREDFDKLISNLDSLDKNTNCNWTVDMVYYKAGIFNTGRTTHNYSDQPKGMMRDKRNKIITKVEDLLVGDLVHFYSSCGSDRTNPDSYNDNDWYHVAFVGEIDYSKKMLYVYDGGSRYMKNRNFKIPSKLDNRINTVNDTSCWVGIRIIDLLQE